MSAGRRPGQKEERYVHLLAGGGDDGGKVPAAPGAASTAPTSLEERVARLEAEVERLRDAVQAGDSIVKPDT